MKQHIFRTIEAPNGGPFFNVDANFGVSACILPAKAISIEIVAKHKKHADAIHVSFSRQTIVIERQKTGLINDLLFWGNDWKNAVQIRIHMPLVKKISASNGAIVHLTNIQFTTPELVAINGAHIELTNCILENPIKKTEFGGSIQTNNEQETKAWTE